MAVVTIRQLLDSGVHFGHQTRRWNPKVKRFILTERSGIHIIDLQQSLTYIDKAYEFVKETVAHGGTVLFVGTKKQAQEVIAEQATRVGQPYVNQRWLGGLLTNFQTVSKRLARMKELEELDYENPADSGFTKKELLLKKRELDKLHKSLGGIRNLPKTPSAIWVVDAKREHLAINEATKLGIPVIGILDTNADPDEFQYPIPGNDDAIRSVGLLTRIIADAAAEGLIQRHQPDRRVGRGRRAPRRLGARAARAGRARARPPPRPRRGRRRGRVAARRAAPRPSRPQAVEAEAVDRDGRRRPSRPRSPTRPLDEAVEAEPVAEVDAAEADAGPPAGFRLGGVALPRAVVQRSRRGIPRELTQQGAATHGKLHDRRHQGAARAARHRHGRHQEGARRGRRRRREGRRDPAPEGREGQRQARRPLHQRGPRRRARA